MGDDCIALKSGKMYIGQKYKQPCEDITIRNCLMQFGHGAIVLGSEMSGGIKNLKVDDYEILCWDVVSGPSTPNAWIDLDEKKLEPYIESKTNDNKKVVNEDKFSKFDNWLMD